MDVHNNAYQDSGRDLYLSWRKRHQDTKGREMTVLPRRQEGSAGLGKIGKGIVAGALVVGLGVAAGFGLEAVGSGDSAPSFESFTATETVNDQIAYELAQVAEMRARQEAGAAYGAALEAAAGTLGSEAVRQHQQAMINELGALQGSYTFSVGSEAMRQHQEALAGELAALQGDFTFSVGSEAIGANNAGLAWELDQIRGSQAVPGAETEKVNNSKYAVNPNIE